MLTSKTIAAASGFMAAALLSTAADAATWNVDYKKSTIGYTILWDGEPSVAVFTRWKGDIQFDPADLANSKVTATIDVGSAVSDLPDYDADRAGPQGFDVAKYPTAQFVSTGFKSLGGDKYEVTGNFTLKGVTKPITIPFTLTIAGDTAHAVGETTVNRIDFKAGSGKTMGYDFTTENPVAFAVKIPIDITATKAP